MPNVNPTFSHFYFFSTILHTTTKVISAKGVFLREQKAAEEK